MKASSLAARTEARTQVTIMASAPQERDDILDPRQPHDALEWSAFSSAYNYDLVSDRRRVFCNQVLNLIRSRSRPVRVLDIGCGHGPDAYDDATRELARRSLAELRRHIDEYWGVEPDEKIVPAHGLFTNFQHAFMETAKLPASHFDVAYSYFVMEHVKDPAAFLAAVFRVLKPGGVYLCLTPNGRHYFTRMARTLKTLHLDEMILRAVRGSKVEEYHYPVFYRFNHRHSIERHARAAGFRAPEFAFMERSGMGGPQSYFPSVLRPIYRGLCWKRHRFRRAGNLLEMLVKLEKPATGV